MVWLGLPQVERYGRPPLPEQFIGFCLFVYLFVFLFCHCHKHQTKQLTEAGFNVTQDLAHGYLAPRAWQNIPTEGCAVLHVLVDKTEKKEVWGKSRLR